jgi:hypothetical protein
MRHLARKARGLQKGFSRHLCVTQPIVHEWSACGGGEVECERIRTKT